MARRAGTRDPLEPDRQPPVAAGEPSEAAAARKPPGRLLVVATPIGNLGDIAPRARDALAQAGLVACEDTRVTGRLLHHLGLKRPLVAYHDHNADKVRPRLLKELGEGREVALVSDAGTPCISDPGHKLVREAAAMGVEVVAVPGPSAVIAALSIAGLPTDRFLFAGFLPARRSARRATLAELRNVPATLVLYETAPRLAASLADAAAVLGPRPAAIARELTKRFEEVRRGDLAGLAAQAATAPAPKGEIVLVIGPPEAAAPVVDDAAVDAALDAALKAHRAGEAAALVAAATGRPRREVYARALLLKTRAGG
jgi:16S rRNA (cytidine1402-2'-O)-methyltransferase